MYCSHYSDVIMGSMTSQMTSFNIVYSAVYSGADQRKHQSSASLASERGTHRWPVNSPHKLPQQRGKCLHLMTSSCLLGNRCSSLFICETNCNMYGTRMMPFSKSCALAVGNLQLARTKYKNESRSVGVRTINCFLAHFSGAHVHIMSWNCAGDVNLSCIKNMEITRQNAHTCGCIHHSNSMHASTHFIFALNIYVLLTYECHGM